MENKKQKKGLFMIPKNGYKVSETTAEIVDCIRMFDDFYSKVSDMIDMIYGGRTTDERLDEMYFPKWSEIHDLLYEELMLAIEYNLADLSNAHNEDEIIL